MGSYYSIDTYLGPRINPFEWQPIAVFILFYRGLRPVARRIPTRFERIKVRNDAKEKKKKLPRPSVYRVRGCCEIFLRVGPNSHPPYGQGCRWQRMVAAASEDVSKRIKKIKKMRFASYSYRVPFCFFVFFYRSVFLSRQRWNSVKRKSKKKKTIELI